MAPGSLRLGRSRRRHPPAAGRDQGPGGVDDPLLQAGYQGDPADPCVHALLLGPPVLRAGGHRGADDQRRRLLHPGSPGFGAGVRGRRRVAGLVQPVQSARAGLHEGGIAGGRRHRRSARWSGVLRRDPFAAGLPRRPRTHSVRLDLRGGSRTHPHRDLRVQGLEPARTEVRRRALEQLCRPGDLGGDRFLHLARGQYPRSRGQHRGVPRRGPLAFRGARLPGRQSQGPGRPAG